MARLGTVKKLGYDKDGHERRERLDAICECTVCGKQVECWRKLEREYHERFNTGAQP